MILVPFACQGKSFKNSDTIIQITELMHTKSKQSNRCTVHKSATILLKYSMTAQFLKLNSCNTTCSARGERKSANKKNEFLYTLLCAILS